MRKTRDSRRRRGRSFKWNVAAGFAAIVAQGLLAGLGHDARAADDKASDAPELERAAPPSMHRLANGMRVVIAPSHRAPLVGMALKYDAGSGVEDPSRPGLAELVQRAVAQESRHLAPGEYDATLPRLGIVDGVRAIHDYAATSSVTTPRDGLETMLWMWSDQMAFAREALPHVTLGETRAGVGAVRTRVEATPYGCVGDVVRAALYPVAHPYRTPDSLPASALDGTTAKDMVTFYDRNYAPNRAVLTLVGDVNEEAALALARKYFEALPAGPEEAAPPAPPRLDGETRIEMVAAAEAPEVLLTWPTVALYEEDDVALDVLSRVLVNARSGILNGSLISVKKVATNVEARQHSHRYSSTYTIRVVGVPGVSPDVLLADVDRVLSDDAAIGREARRAARELTREMRSETESVGTRADRLASYTMVKGDPMLLPKLLRRLERLDGAALVAAVRRQLPLDRRIIARVQHEAGAPVCGAVVGKHAPMTTGAK